MSLVSERIPSRETVEQAYEKLLGDYQQLELQEKDIKLFDFQALAAIRFKKRIIKKTLKQLEEI